MATYINRTNTVKYTAADTINTNNNIILIAGAGVLAMTLQAPDTVADEGKIITIVATTAQAHTVTYTTGFNGGGTSVDVATFGGTIGDNMTILATGGTWLVLNLTNVTLG